MSDGTRITLRGLDDAQKQLARIERATENMTRFKATLYSRRPYAWGINYGTHRVSGRVARRAGGVMFMERARDEVMSGADKDLAEGLSKVSAPGVWVIKRVALWARRLAREFVVRRKGKLRSSIKVRVEPR